MTNDKLVKKIYDWEPISTGLAGRPEVNGKMILKKI
jgi:hypothetical protein